MHKTNLFAKYEVNPRDGHAEMAILVQKLLKIAVSAHLFGPGDFASVVNVTQTRLKHTQDLNEEVCQV